MRWLPKLFNRDSPHCKRTAASLPSSLDLQPKLSNALLVKEQRELAIKQTAALETLAASTKALVSFLEGGGLNKMLQGYSKGLAVNGVLQGLVQSMGRQGLDARMIHQNMVDTFHAVDKMYDGFAERLASKAQADRDPSIHDAEAEYLKYKEQSTKRDE